MGDTDKNTKLAALRAERSKINAQIEQLRLKASDISAMIRQIEGPIPDRTSRGFGGDNRVGYTIRRVKP